MTVTLTREQLEFRSKIYGNIGWTCWWLLVLWLILKAFGVIV